MDTPQDIIGIVNELQSLQKQTDGNTMFHSESETFYLACRKHIPAIAARLIELEENSKLMEAYKQRWEAMQGKYAESEEKLEIVVDHLEEIIMLRDAEDSENRMVAEAHEALSRIRSLRHS